MATKQIDRPKVIFIASLSHSGSTLLDLMLNAHPDVVSVGELKQLGRFAREEKANRRLHCTCGATTLWTCDFWSKVSARTEAGVGRSIGKLNVEDYGDREHFAEDNVALFEAISAVSGKQYVVDSSKHVERLSLLLKNPALTVVPIFLLRDPKGQICSSKKTSSSIIKLIGDYVRTNREIYDLVKHRPHSVVRYEQLVRAPEQVLNGLMRDLGLSYDPQQLEWASQVRHNVGGNGMRRSRSSELKLDEKWRDHFTLLQKLTIDAGTLLGRYPFARSVPPGTAAGTP
jgi:Sulfotransferase family